MAAFPIETLRAGDQIQVRYRTFSGTLREEIVTVWRVHEGSVECDNGLAYDIDLVVGRA